MTIYKTFFRPNPDNADIMYDKPLNELFQNKLEVVQYNAALVITGAVRGTSHNLNYSWLGLESLAERKWSRKILFFLKMINGLSSLHL